MTRKNRVGLGTFPLAGVFSPISKNSAKEIIRLFLNKGGYYIDTAPLYGFGEVEMLLGEVLNQYPRDKYYLITKCGYVDIEGKTFQTVKKSGKYDDVLRECDRSLQRLKIDYIDLYFVHSPDPNTTFEETMSALIKLQQIGKIKEIGLSNINLKELKEYHRSGKVKFIQNRFSLINRSIDKELEHYLLANKIGLVPYQVIDRGQLTEKVFKGISNFNPGDLRIGRSDWQPDKLDVISDWVKDNLSPLAKKLNVSIGQLSIAWALHQKYLSFVIVGMTNRKYIPINLKSNEIKLEPKVLEEIDTAYFKLEKEIQDKFGATIREFRGLNEKFF